MTEHTHHPAASAPVRNHESITPPQQRSEMDLEYATRARREPTIPERIDQLFDRAEECNRRMVKIEGLLALYEVNLGI